METGKSSNSDTFSPPENDHRMLEKSTGDSAGVGRSYECTFCKRGFTNAQALGGHMNIHRKDKAKAKQKNRDEVTTLNTPNNNNIKPADENNNYFRQIPSPDHHHHHQQQQISYQVYLPPPRNPSFQTDNNYNNHLPTTFWRRENYDGHVDANLSLRIGLSPPPVEDEEDGNAKENDDVDLELRL